MKSIINKEVGKRNHQYAGNIKTGKSSPNHNQRIKAAIPALNPTNSSLSWTTGLMGQENQNISLLGNDPSSCTNTYIMPQKRCTL